MAVGVGGCVASVEVREGWEWGKSDWKLKNPRPMSGSRFQIPDPQPSELQGINTFFQKRAGVWFIGPGREWTQNEIEGRTWGQE